MLSTHLGKLAAVAGAALVAVTSGPETTSSRAPVDDPVDYKKEIELVRKKHDSETQALLEGFEVKLNFERKLNKLKGKK